MLNKTISYKRKKKIYSVNVAAGQTDRVTISVNNIICGCATVDNFIESIDRILNRAVDRYALEQKFGLVA